MGCCSSVDVYVSNPRGEDTGNVSGCYCTGCMAGKLTRKITPKTAPPKERKKIVVPGPYMFMHIDQHVRKVPACISQPLSLSSPCLCLWHCLCLSLPLLAMSLSLSVPVCLCLSVYLCLSQSVSVCLSVHMPCSATPPQLRNQHG